MRSITVAATLILLLTAHANSQNLNMLGGTSRPVTQEEVAKKKAAEEATPEISEASLPTTKESTPLATPSSGRSTPMMQGRHAVRSRYIAQKKLASMDAASLNQVCSHLFPDSQ